MSHFIATVILPDDGCLDEIMEPYWVELAVECRFEPVYDLKSMQQKYRKSLIQSLKKHVEDWEGYPGVICDGELGYMSTSNPNAKWDWWVIGGRWRTLIILCLYLMSCLLITFQEPELPRDKNP